MAKAMGFLEWAMIGQSHQHPEIMDLPMNQQKTATTRTWIRNENLGLARFRMQTSWKPVEWSLKQAITSSIWFLLGLPEFTVHVLWKSSSTTVWMPMSKDLLWSHSTKQLYTAQTGQAQQVQSNQKLELAEGRHGPKGKGTRKAVPQNQPNGHT